MRCKARQNKSVLRVCVLFCATAFLFVMAALPVRAEEEFITTLSEPLNDYSGNTLDTFAVSTQNETPLGGALADAARFAADADVCVLCGGDVGQGIASGAVSMEDAEAAVLTDSTLALATISPAELKRLLEYGLSNIVVGNDEYIDRAASSFSAYPQVAGFTLYYDPTAPVGDRVMGIRTEDDGLLDLTSEEETLTLCTTVFHLEGGYGLDESIAFTDTGITLRQAFIDWLSLGKASETSSTNRTLEYGTNDNSIYSRIPQGIVIVIIGIIALVTWQRSKFRPKKPEAIEENS